jgi:hypothetical protein
MREDSAATWQSVLTTFVATALVGSFTLSTYDINGPVIWIALGAASILTVGLFLWAGFFRVGLQNGRYVHLLRGLGFSVLGLAVPILVLTLVRLVALPGTGPQTILTPTNLLEAAWVFAMQVQALRELAGLSYLAAIAKILLGLALLALAALAVFRLTFRIN